VTRYLHALACLYALTACGLIRCAYVSSINGSTLHTAFFAGAAVLLATAIAHHSYQRDELRHARRVADSLRRPPATRATAEDDTVAIALAEACCERWWTSAGAEHEPTTCTRKDSTA
jgi:hypothetical protein